MWSVRTGAESFPPAAVSITLQGNDVCTIYTHAHAHTSGEKARPPPDVASLGFTEGFRRKWHREKWKLTGLSVRGIGGGRQSNVRPRRRSSDAADDDDVHVHGAFHI